MKVPALDLPAQYASIQHEIEAVVADLFSSQWFVLGPRVAALEETLAAYCQCRHAIGVSSGTDAILASLMALGIGPGDEVITTPFTFFATAGCVRRLGATPVFVDIDPETFNIDPDAIGAAITDRTRAIIPVHLYGQCAEMAPILALAEKHDLAVIEDACQAIGAETEGKRAGSFGTTGCFSFFPSKNLGGAGDGGLITTQDDDLAEHLMSMRMHGETSRYHHRFVGANFRLDALQAAVVHVKFRKLDAWIAARQARAARYTELFEESGLVERGLVRPPVCERARHVYHQYVIRVPQRDDLQARLRDEDIGASIYYPLPLHLQECFADLGYQAGQLPASEAAAKEVLALPIYPELSDEQQQYVVQRIGAFYQG